VIVITADIIGMATTGVRRVGGMTIIVMKGADIGCITNLLRRHRHATGTMSTGTKVRHQATGVMVLRDIGEKGRLQVAGKKGLRR